MYRNISLLNASYSFCWRERDSCPTVLGVAEHVTPDSGQKTSAVYQSHRGGHHIPCKTTWGLYSGQREASGAVGDRLHSIKRERWVSAEWGGYDWSVWTTPQAGREPKPITQGNAGPVPGTYDEEGYLSRGSYPQEQVKAPPDFMRCQGST